MHSNVSHESIRFPSSHILINAEDKDINGLSVVITNYKHSDLHAKAIFIPRELGNAACPVKAVHNYLSTFGNTKGSLFQFRSGSPVTHSYFTSSLNSTPIRRKA
jgi:hypothetical protein